MDTINQIRSISIVKSEEKYYFLFLYPSLYLFSRTELNIFKQNYIYQFIIYFLPSMIKIRQVASLLLNPIVTRPITFMSNDSKWKEREQTAENLYISQKEKQLVKKLLRKIDNEDSTSPASDDEFGRRLKSIFARYKIENAALQAQITNLHRNS